MKKIAALCTTYWPASHADVIVSRWIDPAPRDGEWGWKPETEIASLYVAQDRPDKRLHGRPPSEWRATGFSSELDLAGAITPTYGVPRFATIREALTLGGDALAVDGVLLIGEHGDYPFNEYQQHLYPRKEFFDEIVAVFRASDRAVPVFCDKHLSWNAVWAREMVATAVALGFPLMAGSSMPYSLRVQPPIAPGSVLREGVSLYHVGVEVYGFHNMEGMQALVETRAGGEAGIRALSTYQGDAVWEAMANGAWSQRLFDAALSACPPESIQPGDIRANTAASTSSYRPPSPVAFSLEHADGLKTTHILLDGHLSDYGFAIESTDGALHTGSWEWGDSEVFYAHFAALDAHIQQMVLAGQPSPHAPIARTLLTTLTMAEVMRALHDTPGQRVLTPHLVLPYHGAGATFARRAS